MIILSSYNNIFKKERKKEVNKLNETIEEEIKKKKSIIVKSWSEFHSIE